MRRDSWAADFARVDWGAVWNWLLCFGLVAFLGLEGGGYDPLVHDQVGIAAWWVVLATALAGALPRRRIGRLGLTALILLAAFAVWVALSLIWTESAERTFAELARVTSYVGVFALATMSRDPRETQRQIGAIASAIVVVVGAGLLSRLHPAWFEDANQTGRILDSVERLSYPLNYWNGLGAITAMGIPLLLALATGAKSVIARALSAAAIPALMLTLFFALSRGGIIAAAVGAAVFFAFAADRLPKLATLAVAGAGGGFLVLLAHGKGDLVDGLSTATAHDQGNEMLLIGILVCAAVGLVQAGLALAGAKAKRPAWTRPSKQGSTIALGAVLVVGLVLALAVDAPGRLSDAWDEFKGGGGPGEGTERLTSIAGEDRYAFWTAAVDENSTAPLIGTGAGTFIYWWAREGGGGETVRDAHSLYLQTLGELGIAGLALLAAFLIVVLAGGARNALLSEGAERSRLAAALAACSVFCLTAAVDWMWQMPVLPVTVLLLAACLLTVGKAGEKPRLAIGLRVGVAAVALVAIVAIAIPLASLSLVRQSEAEARAGNLSAALDDARSAQNVEPGAATPRLQQALVLELSGDFGAAEAAARQAVDREETNWRNWLVLSRIAAENGRPAAAVAAYREARSLNPEAEVFRR